MLVYWHTHWIYRTTKTFLQDIEYFQLKKNVKLRYFYENFFTWGTQNAKKITSLHTSALPTTHQIMHVIKQRLHKCTLSKMLFISSTIYTAKFCKYFPFECKEGPWTILIKKFISSIPVNMFYPLNILQWLYVVLKVGNFTRISQLKVIKQQAKYSNVTVIFTKMKGSIKGIPVHRDLPIKSNNTTNKRF